MEFHLFSDIDGNFSVALTEDGEIKSTINIHPKTKMLMDRETAWKLGEELSNPKVPETKAEFFEFMEEEDYEKYVMAEASISDEVKNKGLQNVSVDTRSFHLMLMKIGLVPNFTFKEKEIQTLSKFCKSFNISVIPSYENE